MEKPKRAHDRDGTTTTGTLEGGNRTQLLGKGDMGEDDWGRLTCGGKRNGKTAGEVEKTHKMTEKATGNNFMLA